MAERRRPSFISTDEDEQSPLLGRNQQRPQVQLGEPIDLDSLRASKPQEETQQPRSTPPQLGDPIDLNELRNSTILKDAKNLPVVTQEALDHYDPDLSNPDVGRMRSAVNAFFGGLTQFVPNSMKTKALIEAKIHENLGFGGKVLAAASRLTPVPMTMNEEAAVELYQSGEKIGQFLEEVFPENAEYREEFWAGMVARGAGQMTGQVLVSLATGGVGGGAAAVFAVNSLMMSTLGTQYYEEAIEEGSTDGEAFSYMLANMAGNSALNALPMVMMMRRINTATGGALQRTVKAGFKGSIEEGITEGVQQWYSNMTAQQIYGSTRDLMDGVLEGMAVGAILGATANVTTNALIGERFKAQNEERMLEIERTIAMVDEQVKAGVMPDGNSSKQRAKKINDKLDPEFKEQKRPKKGIVQTDEAIAQNKPVKKVEERSAWERWKNKMWDWFPMEEGAGRIIDQGKNEFAGELRRAQMYVADLVEAVYTVSGVNSPTFRDSSIGKLIDEGHVDPDISVKIDNALRDKNALKALPEGLQEPVNNLRKHIDFLSNELVRRGHITPEMKAKFDENMGAYVHRSYRLHDSTWNETTIPRELWAITENKLQAGVHNQLITNPKNLKKHLRAMGIEGDLISQYANLSRKEQKVLTKRLANSIMKEILAGTGQSSVARVGQILNAPPTKKQLRKQEMSHKKADAKTMKDMKTDDSVLKERENIPQYLREFMGEYHDGTLNYVRTVEHLAGLMARRTMFDNLARAYRGSLFLTEHQKNQTEHRTDYKKMDTGTKSDLDGLWLHKDLVEKLMHDPISSGEGTGLEYLYKFNMATKFAKTVLSHVTVVRNITGGLMFLGFNGHMPSPTAANYAWNRARVAFMSDKMMSKSQRKEHWQKLSLEYERLGLFGKSVRAGELARTAAEAGFERHGTPENFATTQKLFERVMSPDSQKGYDQRGVSKFFGKLTKKAADFYRAGDDFVRILFYELELARNEKNNIYDSASRKQETANDVLNFYQNYDRVGRMWDTPRRFPLLAPFVSFPAEVSRTMYNTGERIYQDINSGDAGRKSVGYQRLGGVMSTVIGIQVAAAASQLLHNITDEDDQAYREFMPPWDKNSIVIYTSAERGKVRYINTSYTNPYAYFMDPFVALTKGADHDTVLQRSMAGLKELFEPLLGEEIFAQAAREVATNTKTGGGEVYNPQDLIGDKIQKSFLHMWSAFEPGSLTSAKRAIEPFSDDTSDRQASDELMGLFGLRLITVDIKESFGFSIREHRQSIRDARRVYNAVKYREGSTLKEQSDALARANTSYENQFNQMANLIDAAQSTGIWWEDLEEIMKDSGLAQRDIQALRNGVFRPFDP